MNDVHSGIRCDNTRVHLQVNFKKLSARCATRIVEIADGYIVESQIVNANFHDLPTIF